MTGIQLRSIEDIERALEQIESIIATHRNSLPKEEREKIVRVLDEISRKEGLLDTSLERTRTLVRSLDLKDEKELAEMKRRLGESEGKEAKILKVEIRAEEEKLRMEKEVSEHENVIAQGTGTLNRLLTAAMERLRESRYPYDAKPYIAEARTRAREIIEGVRKLKELEKRLVRMVKTEERLLNKEAVTA